MTSHDRATQPNVWRRIALVFALSVGVAPITYFLWIWVPVQGVWLITALAWVYVSGRLVFGPARARWGDGEGVVAAALVVVTTLCLAVVAAGAFFFLLIALFAGDNYE